MKFWTTYQRIANIKKIKKEIKSLYEELAKLDIDEISTSSNESQRPSSIETVIHVKKDEDQDEPVAAALCPPIPGGQV